MRHARSWLASRFLACSLRAPQTMIMRDYERTEHGCSTSEVSFESFPVKARRVSRGLSGEGRNAEFRRKARRRTAPTWVVTPGPHSNARVGGPEINSVGAGQVSDGARAEQGKVNVPDGLSGSGHFDVVCWVVEGVRRRRMNTARVESLVSNTEPEALHSAREGLAEPSPSALLGLLSLSAHHT